MDNRLTEYILKYSKKRDRDLKYDFMPSILEIIEKPSHIASRIIIYAISTLVLFSIVWMAFSKVDVVVDASGVVRPTGDLMVVRTYNSGIVNEIKVISGEYVDEGQVLITLETEGIDIDISQISEQKRIAEIQLEIYKMIINEEDTSLLDMTKFDEVSSVYVESILDADKTYRNQVEILKNDLSDAKLNIEIAKLQLGKYKDTGNYKEAQIQELLISQYENSASKAELSVNNAMTQYRIQINSRIADLYRELEQLQAQVDKYDISRGYQYIKAPVSGYINTININTPGETVAASEELVTIIPDDAPLEVVCYVKNMDIADISEGMDVEVKLEAYSYNRFGTVKGKIINISPGAVRDEEMGNVYPVRIQLQNDNQNIRLLPGLTGVVEIKTGKRSILEYFMEPVIKGFNSALKQK